MYSETCTAMANTAAGKVRLLKSRPAAFVVSSVLAGMFVAFGSVIFLSTGGMLTAAGSPLARFLACLMFSAALSLVIMAGSDLFTGNNLTVGMGILEKAVSVQDAVLLWAVCWLGNLAGSLAVAFMFHFAGLSSAAATAAYTAATALAKTTAAPTVLFWKGVLCNLCVCLAVWCAAKMKSESGKLIMVVWCILIFMLCGFEHSVANMSIIPLGLLTGAEGVTLAGFAKNLLFVTVGNFAGGFGCVALPYWFISKQK